MTRATARRWLFAVGLVTLPLPFYLGALELSPWIRLAFLSALLGSVALSDGGGTISLLGGLGALQTLVGALLVWTLAALVALGIGALRPPALRGAALAAILLALVAGSFLDIYDTSLSSTRPRSNVLHLFE